MHLEKILKKLRDFTRARGWDKFHNPKDLAIGVSIEAAELLEHFAWKTKEESAKHAEKNKEEVAEEIADVAIYLIMLADHLNLDFYEIIDAKIKKNAVKYPAPLGAGEVSGSCR